MKERDSVSTQDIQAALEQRLFLVIYDRPAGYVDGELSMGLFWAADKESAIDAAVKTLGVWGEDDSERHRVRAVPCGEMTQIVSKPSTYDDT